MCGSVLSSARRSGLAADLTSASGMAHIASKEFFGSMDPSMSVGPHLQQHKYIHCGDKSTGGSLSAGRTTMQKLLISKAPQVLATVGTALVTIARLVIIWM